MSLESRLKMSLAHMGRTDSRIGHCHSEESKRQMSLSHVGQIPWIMGKKHTSESRDKMRDTHLGVPHSEAHCLATASAIKIVWSNPITRKKYYDALQKTKWLKVRTDMGQVELLEKWNRLGFKFEPNYQVHTDTDLFYVDGYDPIHNVVIEYDGKYHFIPSQQQKDLVRQQKIIDILQPKKFWRYDAVNKWCKNVIGG